jgi:hypothetical protein
VALSIRYEGSMRSMRSMRGGFIFRNRGSSLKVPYGIISGSGVDTLSLVNI